MGHTPAEGEATDLGPMTASYPIRACMVVGGRISVL